MPYPSRLEVEMDVRSFFKTTWRWQLGRQGTGYEKCLLLTGLWPKPFDLYLLRYRPGHGIPPHRDPVPNGRHFRANIILCRGKSGGAFLCDAPLFASPRLFVFRSDLSEHAVEPMVSGTRYVLSLGWILKDA
jgi:hypothetical protein